MSPLNELDLLKLHPDLFVVAIFCRSPNRCATRTVFHQATLWWLSARTCALSRSLVRPPTHQLGAVTKAVTSDVIEAHLHYELSS